jgi:hypothetical protein
MTIKVCPDPQCEAVYHNCLIKHTRCNNCGGWIKRIDNDTYWRKFSNIFFQYDFNTMEYYYPIKNVTQLSLFQ